MKQELPFDEFAKKQFSNFEPEVPTRIWENIVAERSNRKPKGFWASWLTGKTLLITGGVLILASFGIYKIMDQGKQDQTEFIGKNDRDEQVSGESKTANVTINQKSTQVSTDKGNTDTINADLGPGAGVKSVNQQNPSKEAGSILIPGDPGADKAESISQQGNDPLFKMKSKVSPAGRLANTNVAKGNNGSIVIEGEDPGLLENNKRLLQREDFQSSMRKLRGINISNELSKKPMLKLPDCPAIEKDAAANKKYFELYAGPDYAFSNYKTFGDTSSSNYAKKRKESTGFSSAYSAGARFTKVFNNAMSLRTGVNYSQINEKFKYINLAEIRFITVITTRVIIRAPGDTIYINDTLRYQQSGSRVKTTYNKYRSIDIPLMFGYEMGNGKLHANLSAGAIINIYSWYKGDVLDSLYQPVSITTGKNSSQYQYKTNIGVGFITSVSVYYKLNDKWHLLLEPYFRYNLSPMSKENLNLQQRYHVAGLRAGIRLDLGQRK